MKCIILSLESLSVENKCMGRFRLSTFDNIIVVRLESQYCGTAVACQPQLVICVCHGITVGAMGGDVTFHENTTEQQAHIWDRSLTHRWFHHRQLGWGVAQHPRGQMILYACTEITHAHTALLCTGISICGSVR